MSVIQKPEPVVKNEASESVFAPATERYELLDKEPEMEPYALRFSTETAYDESKAPQTISHPVPVESSSQGPGSLPQTAGNFSLYNFFCCFFCIPIFFFLQTKWKFLLRRYELLGELNGMFMVHPMVSNFSA